MSEQDPHPGGEGEEEEVSPNQLPLLHQFDWTLLQLAVQRTNKANQDLGELFIHNMKQPL